MRQCASVCIATALLLSAGSLNATTILAIGGSIQSSLYPQSRLEVAALLAGTANETDSGDSIGLMEARVEDFSDGSQSNLPLRGGADAGAVNDTTWSTDGEGSSYYYLDNILTMTAIATPEPGTGALAAGALAWLAGVWMVRRQHHAHGPNPRFMSHKG
jgi:hypothetical protein